MAKSKCYLGLVDEFENNSGTVLKRISSWGMNGQFQCTFAAITGEP